MSGDGASSSSSAAANVPSDASIRHTSERMRRTREWAQDLSKLVLVIGTGVSRAAADPPAGLNVFSWVGLLEAGLAHVMLLHGSNSDTVKSVAEFKQDLKRGTSRDYANAGDFIKETLGDMEFQKFIKGCYEFLPRKPNQRILSLIHAVHARGAKLVTTNYDNLLKDSAPGDFNVWKRGVEGDADEWMRSNPQNQKERGVYHIHGHWSKTKNVVFTTTDYHKVVLADPEVQKLMRSWASRVVVFIGCGDTPNDFNFSSLLKALDKDLTSLNASALNFFWTVREEEFDEKNKRQLPLVNIVSYGDKYEHLDNFLEQMLDDKVKDSADAAFARWEQARAAKADAQKELFYHIFCHSTVDGGLTAQQLQALSLSDGQIEQSTYDNKTFTSRSNPGRKVYYRLYSINKGIDAKQTAQRASDALMSKAKQLTLRKHKAVAVAAFQHVAHYYAVIECNPDAPARALLEQFVFTGFRVLSEEENLAPARDGDKDVLLFGFWCFPAHLSKPISTLTELGGKSHADVLATVRLEPKSKTVMQQQVAPALYRLMYHWGLRIDDEWDVSVEQLKALSESCGDAIITQVNDLAYQSDDASEPDDGHTHSDADDGSHDDEKMADESAAEAASERPLVPDDFDICLSGPAGALARFQDRDFQTEVHGRMRLPANLPLYVGIIKCPRYPRCQADLVTFHEPRGQGSQHKCQECSRFIRIGHAAQSA